MADDFSEALRMFTGAVQDYQIQNAFKDATAQFKQLSQNETDLFKRRQAEEQFAKDLTQNMLGMGASPEQVKMGFQTFMPKSMTGSKDFFNAAANTPKGKDRQALLARGKELQAQEDAMTPYQREQIKLGWAGLVGQPGGATGPGKGDELPPKEAEKVDEATYRYKSLKENAANLEGLIKEHGTNILIGPEGYKMDKIIQDMAIDYAKMVDPESVAREGEVEAAKKYQLPIRDWGGLGMTNNTARTLIKDYMKSLDDRMRNQLASKKKLTSGKPLPSNAQDIDALNTELQKQIQNNGDPARIQQLRQVIERAKSQQRY